MRQTFLSQSCSQIYFWVWIKTCLKKEKHFSISFSQKRVKNKILNK